MLVALVGLIYVLSPWSFSLNGVFDGSFPWIFFGLALFFATRKGGCGRRSSHCASK